jgi:hypothetical protein
VETSDARLIGRPTIEHLFDDDKGPDGLFAGCRLSPWASGHQTTSTIPNVSSAIAVANMKPGDVFNKAGSHVVLFAAKVSGGYDIYESTAASSIDRVTHRSVDSSYVNGYSPRRYDNACP